MPLRRVLSGDAVAQAQADGAARAIRAIETAPGLPWGVPTKIVSRNHTARFGELVRVDPSTAALTVTLPTIKPGDIGRAITVVNTSSSYNTVTISSRGGGNNATIGANSTYSIARPYFRRTFVAISETLWADETADLGASASDLPIPWFTWNGTDLSQFGTVSNGSNVTSGTWAVVNAFGHNWIAGTCTTNGGAGPYAAPRDVPNQGTILPIATLPPTANYFVSAEVKFQTTISTSRTGCGVVLRWATGNTGYVVMRGSRDASGSGYTHLTGVLSPGTSPEFMEVIAQYDDGPPNIGEGGAVYGGTSIKGQVYGQMLAGTAGGGALWTSSIASARAFFVGYSVVTAANKAGLIVSNMDTQVGTSVVYFRNIRCYPADIFGALM